MPFFKPVMPADHDARVEAVIEDLARREASKPRTQKSLLATINARFNEYLNEQPLATLLASLCNRGVVQVDGTKITYSLPA